VAGKKSCQLPVVSCQLKQVRPLRRYGGCGRDDESNADPSARTAIVPAVLAQDDRTLEQCREITIAKVGNIMSYKLKFVVLGVLVALQLAAYGQNKPTAAQDAKPASEAKVKIDNFSFTPPTITVAAGTTVRWTNGDDIPHTVVSEEQTFKSKVLDTDQEFTFTFSKPGTYTYFCSIHPHMTGTVVVQ
jgi:plastocyanin